MSDLLRIAMPKGNKLITHKFREAGYRLRDDFDESRSYIISLPENKLEFILAKPMDVPVYVEYGVADLGIVGKEILLEQERDVYELCDLDINQGHLSLIGQQGVSNTEPIVATAYPQVAFQYFRKQGLQMKLVKINGELEQAIHTGLANYIVDVVAADGEVYWEELGLVEWARINRTSSRLICNRASYILKNNRIQELANKLLEKSI